MKAQELEFTCNISGLFSRKYETFLRMPLAKDVSYLNLQQMAP